ncbi:MAG: hypothetical protein ACQESX_05440 [Bacteroidota bacterium]
MRTWIWIAGVVFLLSLSQCTVSEKEIFTAKQAFENDTWQRFQILDFDIPFEEENKAYDLYFTVTYSEDFQHDNIPLHAILKTPAGSKRVNEFTIEVRDANGQDIGEKADDAKYYTLKAPLWQELTISEPGEASLSLEQIIPKFKTPGIKEAGITVHYAD